MLRGAELTTLQVLNTRPGIWHVATLSGHLLIVRTDRSASADLYRQVRDEGHERRLKNRGRAKLITSFLDEVDAWRLDLSSSRRGQSLGGFRDQHWLHHLAGQ